MLNKLATKNFDSICGQIIALLKKQRHVEVLMREVFERASSPFTDPYTKDRAYLFVDLYTRLTKKVSDFLEGRRAEPFRVEAEPVTGLQQPSFQVMLLLLVHDAFEYSLEGARSFEMPFPDHLSGRYAAATAYLRLYPDTYYSCCFSRLCKYSFSSSDELSSYFLRTQERTAFRCFKRAST